MDQTTITVDGRTAHISASLLSTVDTLSTLRKGGIASVTEYQTEDGDVFNATFLSRWSHRNLCIRKRDAVQSLSFADVRVQGDKLEVLSLSAQEDWFNKSKSAMLESLEKSIDGDISSNAHRVAHDKFYLHPFAGVRLHLQTVKVKGKTELVLAEDGLPTVDGILVQMIELGRTVITKVEKPVTNSGEKVLMDRCIERCLNPRSVKVKSLSLKEGNFKSLRMDGTVFTPDAIMGRVAETVRTVDVRDLETILETEDARV